MKIVEKSDVIKNIKSNWFFPFSVIAFFCLNAGLSLGEIVGAGIGIIICSVFFIKNNAVHKVIKNSSLPILIFSGLTAAGVCLRSVIFFFERWSASSMVRSVEEMLPFSVDLPLVAGIIGGVVTFAFVFVCIAFFWQKMKEINESAMITDGIKKWEIIIYAVLFLSVTTLVIFAFTKTQAFYATEHYFDVIYTSDSPTLVKENSFLTLYHKENDLRQPLFAVFSAPFTGAAYLIGMILGADATISAILLNLSQIVMLFAANFIISKALDFDAIKRTCFMAVSLCTYSGLLFSLMMEQYLVAYFWLALCFFAVCKKNCPPTIPFCATGGTLLTGVVMLPFLSEHSPFRSFKKWFGDCFRYGMSFIAFLLAFGRADLFLNISQAYARFNYFSGEKLSLADKFIQYSHFMINCFVAPDAEKAFIADNHISWQLEFPQTLNLFGIAVAVIAVIAAVVNYKKISAIFCLSWISFSVIMLVVLGWGTAENGLILYSLYFGWAFLVPIFLLFEKIEKKFNKNFIIPAISSVVCVILLVVNIPAIKEMLDFAITYYPA